MPSFFGPTLTVDGIKSVVVLECSLVNASLLAGGNIGIDRPKPFNRPPTTQPSTHSMILSLSSSAVQISVTFKPTDTSSSRHCASVRSIAETRLIMLMSDLVMKALAFSSGMTSSLIKILEYPGVIAAMVWRRISTQLLKGKSCKMLRK